MKTNLLDSLDTNILRLLKEIGQQADIFQTSVYVVGGFVRDLMLKKKNLDIDIVVEGNAIKFAQDFARDRKCSVTAFKKFGTAAVFFSDGLRIDFATARKEIYPYPGSLPVVSPGRIREDLFRRDFKINAIALKLNAQSLGEVVDDFSGRKDLQERKITVLHSKSFLDDPTRMLRAVRFEQRLNFKIEPQTLKLLKRAFSKRVYKTVTPERYFEEFKKLLSEPSARKSVQRLNILGGLNFLHVKREKIPYIISIFKKITGIKKNFLMLGDSDWLLNFLALTEGISHRQLENVTKQIKLNKNDQKTILSVQKTDQLFKDLSHNALKPSQIFQKLSHLSPTAILYLIVKTDRPEVRRRIKRYLSVYSEVKLEVTGRDLLKLGVPSGEKMGVLLNKILYDKLNGLIKTREQELHRASELKAIYYGD